MAATIECTSCGAPAPAAGSECVYCGTIAPAAPPPPPSAPPPDGRSPAFETIPADLPRAYEARRIRGLAVPLVAAVVVLGIGLPLTAVAVSQVGRLPATDLVPSSEGEGASTLPGGGPVPNVPAAPAVGGGRGQARLAGAVVYEGAISPIGCTGGPPKLALFDAGAERYSVLMNAPGAAPGTYPLGTANATFVAVTKIAGGSQTWTSLGRAGAKGDITIGTNSSVTTRFSGLEGAGGGAEGTIEGTVEVRCG